MAHEKTLAIIKPDGMKHKDDIIKRIKNSGLEIEKIRVARINKEIAAEFYKHIKTNRGETIYQSLIDYMTSGEVMPMVLHGENAVQKLRSIAGFTDPERAEKGTIRGDLGTDKMRVADSENRATRNIIHSSGNAEEAAREIEFFF